MSSFDENLQCEDDIRGYDEYLARSGAFEDIPEYATIEDIEAALAAQYEARDVADYNDYLDSEFYATSDDGEETDDDFENW